MAIIKELLPFVKIVIIAGVAIPVIALIFFIAVWFKTFKNIDK